jgi:hypothetical protein
LAGSHSEDPRIVAAGGSCVGAGTPDSNATTYLYQHTYLHVYAQTNKHPGTNLDTDTDRHSDHHTYAD